VSDSGENQVKKTSLKEIGARNPLEGGIVSRAQVDNRNSCTNLYNLAAGARTKTGANREGRLLKKIGETAVTRTHQKSHDKEAALSNPPPAAEGREKKRKLPWKDEGD